MGLYSPIFDFLRTPFFSYPVDDEDLIRLCKSINLSRSRGFYEPGSRRPGPTGHRFLNGGLDTVLDERLIKSFEKIRDRLGASYWRLWKIPSHHILQKIRGQVTG
jgi:hypothetical protein